MRSHFKQHISDLVRNQTSQGRDLVDGLRLDRNERVSNFSDQVIADVFSKIPLHSFSASPESSQLYDKIAKSVKVSKDNIYITNGITESIKILYETLTNPGENVVVLDPTYPFYSIYAEMYQIKYRAFGYKNNFAPDWDSLYKALDGKTTFVCIPNPNLPIESVFSVEEIRRIADKCVETDTILVVDEAYHFFGAPSVIDLVNEYDNLVVLRSFSKAYGLAGLRLGFMISAADNIEYLSKTRSIVESNTLTMGIAEYMLDHPELRDEHVEDVKEGGEYIQDVLTQMGYKWFGGKVTNGMLIFLDNKNETEDLVKYLEKKKIYIRGSFMPPCDNCVRISIGPRAIMEKFVEALSQWTEQRDK